MGWNFVYASTQEHENTPNFLAVFVSDTVVSGKELLVVHKFLQLY